MQSTLTLKDADPHDIFLIEPEIVRALRASKSSSDPAHDAKSAPSAPQAEVAPSVAPDIAPGMALPRVEPTFRAPAVDDIKVANERIELPGDRPAMSKFMKRVAMGLFALASAGAAAAWQHYGDTAKVAIADYVPPFVLAWSQPTEKPAAAEQPGAPAVEAAAADQGTAADQAVAQPAQPAQAAAPVVSAVAADTTPSLQTMSRDLASMGQQIEQLKASIAQLKAGQDQMSREMAKTSDARTAEARTSGAMTSVPGLRPKPPAPPVRAAAAPVRKPKPASSALPPPAAPA